jgi:hypothetical protein
MAAAVESGMKLDGFTRRGSPTRSRNCATL